MTRTSKSRSQEIHDPHWVEWLTGIASALLVLVILAWVGHEAIKQTGTPPDLIAEITSDSATEAGRRTEFRMMNRSDRTAAAVTVRGEVVEGANVLEGHEVILDYVPAHSAARGAFIFSSDTSGRQIRIRPTAYAEP
jgi:uncharacterized protein (TIGR02588 family)